MQFKLFLSDSETIVFRLRFWASTIIETVPLHLISRFLLPGPATVISAD
jgi:hypothetical protein